MNATFHFKYMNVQAYKYIHAFNVQCNKRNALCLMYRIFFKDFAGNTKEGSV